MPETGNKPFDFKDKLFCVNNSDEYKISIQVSLDGFSFSIIHKPDNRLVQFNYTPARVSDEMFLPKRLTEWIQSIDSTLDFSKLKVDIIFFTERFTLIPKYFYPNSNESFLKTTIKDTGNNSAYCENKISNPDSVVLFYTPPLLEDCLKGFGGYTILHLVSLMIDDLQKDSSELAAHVLFETNGFYIVAKKFNKLQFVNYFKVSHQNDIIYYLITILKTLKIDPEKLKMLLSGEIEFNDSRFNMIKNIFPNHSFYRPHPGISNHFDVPGTIETRFLSHFI